MQYGWTLEFPNSNVAVKLGPGFSFLFPYKQLKWLQSMYTLSMGLSFPYKENKNFDKFEVQHDMFIVQILKSKYNNPCIVKILLCIHIIYWFILVS